MIVGLSGVIGGRGGGGIIAGTCCNMFQFAAAQLSRLTCQSCACSWRERVDVFPA